MFDLPPSTFDNESELLHGLANGDENALRAVYDKYWHLLFVSAYNVLRDKETCEDIIQEIFVRIWERRSELRVTTSLKSYLFSATRYQVFHTIRKTSGRKELFENLNERVLSEAPDIPLYTKEIQGRVNTAIEALPEKCREIFKLSREHQLSYKEIAERLNISSKTVENQITIALKKLRELLGDLMIFII